MGKPPHVLSEISPGMSPHTEVGFGLDIEVGMGLGLAVRSFLGLTPGTEEDAPLELALGTSFGKGAGMGGGTPPQPLPGNALGSFEDLEKACMAVCTAAY